MVSQKVLILQLNISHLRCGLPPANASLTGELQCRHIRHWRAGVAQSFSSAIMLQG